jgi:hypothetical protein
MLRFRSEIKQIWNENRGKFGKVGTSSLCVRCLNGTKSFKPEHTGKGYQLCEFR